MIDEERYLEKLSQSIVESTELIKHLSETPESYLTVTEILKDILEQETLLRAECEIGSRFNVVVSQLHAMFDQYLQEIEVLQMSSDARPAEASENKKTFVYVYLFNAQGAQLQTWQKLLRPSALFEHSVNRPIYASREQIESLIKAKPIQTQHGYIEIAVDPDDLMETSETATLHDQHGYPLLRLRQGALKKENIEGFYSNGKFYTITEQGILTPQ
ncbi:MAG: type IVB secretion system protein IcmQ [Pseudomonadota bacterium]|nr:type IVB secretion system protein IcmQ [Gammaproteobacteria bacterium]MBU1558475.1 type IVB secretion system protein IcmQ [Gammaproteobacteria bacterium]MBU1629247.1 type IVB secretion system protein IcmQ [Gammaproteobacteria bacterium]MBU1926223.1 type IVB secretion system protein IcmQ [Gammaproteobacteria bacterium]MBU2546539.1 type IVB secretion system protein IcmQ [Gammaproteobacteria bacterium]